MQPDTLNQWNRVLRALKKIQNNKNRNIEEYEDDVWNFFQNCWHLKDWIKNDTLVSKKHRTSVESAMNKVEELCICADIANRSKHLKLTQKRAKALDARVTSRNLNIHAGPPGEGYGEYNFEITLDSKRKIEAIELAEMSVNKWEKLLIKYGILK